MKPATLPKLQQLVAAGETLEQVGARLGVSKSTVHRWIVRIGIATQRPKPRLGDRTIQRIQELRAGGMSVRKVAMVLDVSRGSVYRHYEPEQTYRCSNCGGLNLDSKCMVCSVRGRS